MSEILTQNIKGLNSSHTEFPPSVLQVYFVYFQREYEKNYIACTLFIHFFLSESTQRVL